MSWSLQGESGPFYKELESEVQRAALDSIIFAASGNKSESPKASYPARWENVISICSTDIGGTPSEHAKPEHSNYWLPGEGLEARVPRYLNPKGTEKPTETAVMHGSSGATAVAAGLAALVLTCVRYAFHEVPENAKFLAREQSEAGAVQQAETEFNTFRSGQTIRTLFDNMCTPDASHFVQPWEKFNAEYMTMSSQAAKKELRSTLLNLKKT